MEKFYTIMPSPVGFLKLVATDKGLEAVLWEDDDPGRVRLGAMTKSAEHPVLKQAVQEMREYFAGKRKSFDVDVDFVGTDFQKAVWRALLSIPFGETRSYAQVARAVGKPNAVRAVGGAIGRNPLSVVAPCHRVIGSDGSLTGFAGGMATKQYLLTHEQLRGDLGGADRSRRENNAAAPAPQVAE